MDGLRQIRTRIKSITNIQQITRAMKMVASARLHKAQALLLAARPYAAKLEEVIRDLAGRVGDRTHPLLAAPAVPGSALLVVTSDKGLCAGFNAQVLQAAGRALLHRPGAERPEVLIAGRKGLNFFRRLGIAAYREWAGFFQELNWRHADAMGEELITGYQAGRWSQLTLIYNRFKSVLAQELVQKSLLPIQVAPAAGRAGSEFAFEPSAEAVLAQLLPRYVKIMLYQTLLESKAAELAARMQAMDNATRNAADLIADMTLALNRARQSGITREISELVGGAEAIQGRV